MKRIPTLAELHGQLAYEKGRKAMESLQTPIGVPATLVEHKRSKGYVVSTLRCRNGHITRTRGKLVRQWVFCPECSGPGITEVKA